MVVRFPYVRLFLKLVEIASITTRNTRSSLQGNGKNGLRTTPLDPAYFRVITPT